MNAKTALEFLEFLWTKACRIRVATAVDPINGNAVAWTQTGLNKRVGSQAGQGGGCRPKPRQEIAPGAMGPKPLAVALDVSQNPLKTVFSA